MRWSKKGEPAVGIAENRPVEETTVVMENIAMSSTEARKLDLGLVVEKDSMKAVDEAGQEETNALMMGQQYILERPDSEGGPQVVKLNANGQLVPCEMLPHVAQLEADHQSLVLHVMPQGGMKEAYNIQHLRGSLLHDERYIDALPAAQYEQVGPETTLLPTVYTAKSLQELMPATEITEEERRDAQMLMQVQYGQQPKHKLNLEPLVAASSAEANVIMNVADTLIVDEHLGKVEHSHMVVDYMQPVDGSHYEPKGVRLIPHEQELVELTQARVEEIHQAQHLKSPNEGSIILRRTLMAPSNESRRDIVQQHMQQPHLEVGATVKNEEEDDFESGEDPADSDYEAGKGSRSSKRSLPHKKRIPKKLKNVKSVEKNLKCTKCNETFQTQAELTAHKQNHNKKPLLFNCEICKKSLPSQITFFEHLKSHYEPVKSDLEHIELQPTQDTSGLEQEDAKLVHTSVIVQEPPASLPPPLPCVQCNKVFRRQKTLEAHMLAAHPPPPPNHVVLNDSVFINDGLMPVPVEEIEKKEWSTSAELTPMTAAIPDEHVAELRENTVIVPVSPADDEQMITSMTMQELAAQEEIPAQGSYHVCDHCETGFSLKIQLLEHIREMHTDAKRKLRIKKEETGATAVAAANKKSEQLTCPHCGRVFNHRNSLVYHLKSHTGERPHQCEVCGKSFFAASALKVHMRLHSGDKPYKCELCGRHFRQWGDLKYHCISIHTEEKQYQCEYCGKDFARKYSLIVHRRIHTGEKNYKCEFCGKTFRASSYLQNHRRIHTGEKPHPCEICGKPFRVRSDMKRHLNTHNRERGESSGTVTTTAVPTPSDGQSSQESTVEVGVTQTELTGEEVTLPDGSVVITEESLSQPINLNMSIPVSEEAACEDSAEPLSSEQAIGAEGHENGIPYTRDPLETVRGDNGNTLYVWPIYMN